MAKGDSAGVPLKVVSPGAAQRKSEEGSGSPAEAMAGGLAARLMGIISSLDRQDQLETSHEFTGWLDRVSGDPEGARKAAEELFLRALRAVSDRTNYRILSLAAGQEGRPVGEFCRELDLGRIETVERIHDLAQVGVLAQDLISGTVQLTPLGHGLFETISGLAGRAAEELIQRLSERVE